MLFVEQYEIRTFTNRDEHRTLHLFRIAEIVHKSYSDYFFPEYEIPRRSCGCWIDSPGGASFLLPRVLLAASLSFSSRFLSLLKRGKIAQYVLWRVISECCSCFYYVFRPRRWVKFYMYSSSDKKGFTPFRYPNSLQCHLYLWCYALQASRHDKLLRMAKRVMMTLSAIFYCSHLY